MDGSINYWGRFDFGRPGAINVGEQYLSSSFTALLFSTIPIWVLLLGKLLFKEKLKKFTIVGVVLGSIGFIILISPTLVAQFIEIHSSTTKFELAGVMALIVAALSWSGDRYTLQEQIFLRMYSFRLV
jgi:drug/metabolite transporter (DMT)-like permease